jgi:hypothetical protein
MIPTIHSYANGKATIVTIGRNEFFFSYTTCIAFRGFLPVVGYTKARRENSWGATTGRHFTEMGCKEFFVYNDANFQILLDALEPK